MEAVRVTERLSETVACFSQLFGCEVPSAVEFKNAAPERIAASELDVSTAQVIEAFTSVDREVYNLALQSLEAAYSQTFHGAFPLSHNASN